ncbi:MAG: peptidoglycan DD-metalloendopeptidase family protein, partial [Oscillospiraceae bacterium]
FFVDAFNVMENGFNLHKNRNIFIRFCFLIKAFFKGVYNNRGIFKTWLNYGVPIVSIFAFINLINYVFSLQFAVNVEYNGNNLGYILSETTFEQAEARLQQRMIYMEGDEVIDNIPKFTVAVLDSADIIDDHKLTDIIIKNSGENIIDATGIILDGSFLGAVENPAVIQDSLQKKLDSVKTADTTEVAFLKNIEYDTGLYLSSNMRDETVLLDYLSREVQGEAFDTVQDNDTPIIIAKRNDITLDELVELNPNILTSCVVGRQILVKQSKPFMPIATTKNLTYEQTINHDIIYTDSSAYDKGRKITKKLGRDGKSILTASVKYIDGVEVSREIIDEVIVEKPVAAEVIVGTKKVSYSVTGSKYTGSGAVSNSGFVWPVYGGYISSPFGKRGSSTHSGIDYAVSYGTPIFAALSGKVVSAGWHYSYGYNVLIDHGGGVRTRYAHASRLLVRAGDYVEQKQQIAAVGNTGQSYGNHLHFEVRINGIAKNPMNYLP